MIFDVYFFNGFITFQGEKIKFNPFKRLIPNKCRLFNRVLIKSKSINDLVLANAMNVVKNKGLILVLEKLELQEPSKLGFVGKKGKYFIYKYQGTEIDFKTKSKVSTNYKGSETFTPHNLSLDLSADTKMDMALGMFYGLALGDALGAPHEFRYSYKVEEYTGKLEFPLIYKPLYGGKIMGAVGQITDDTEMTICLLRCIKKGYSRTEAIQEYMEWANSGVKSLGSNTRALLKGVKTVKGFENRWKKIFQNIDSSTQSNGCLMRCSPIALIGNVEEMKEIAKIDCRITNPSPICVDSCIVYLTILHCILNGEPVKEAIDKGFESAETEEVKLLFSERKRNVKQNKGWVLHALWCALFAVKKFDSYREGIDYIIRLGGDTDTNAAIAGALLGAKFGLEKMKEDKITKRNLRILLECDTNKGDIPRPEKYSVSSIEL